MDLSIIIPSRNEQLLEKTVDDIFSKAVGNFEVIVILDEKDQPLKERDGLRVVKKQGNPGLRSAINQGVDLAEGKYIMKCDAHVMFDQGFDVKLLADMQNDWVMIPRRYSLNGHTWSIKEERPIIDYEFMTFPYRTLTSVRFGGKWYERAEERKDILIDDEMAFQGSCWLTTKQHLRNIGGFDINTSTGDEFVLESEELANKTWLSGGRVVVNKKTWYAHLHKGNEWGRGYKFDRDAAKRQRLFHMDYWMHNRWPKAIHKMEWLIEKFWPVPTWPNDWRDPKYERDFYKAIGVTMNEEKTLSIIIPARNEMFLKNTVEDVLSKIEGNTEVIVGLDGYWPDPPINDHPKLRILHYSEPIGQRAITNQCARLAKSKYIMKVDAHCSFDKGFDVKMMDKMEDDITMVPVMRNLHAFDWVCPDGHRRYQGPSGVCTVCGKNTEKDVLWKAKNNPKSTSYRFDKDMHFQYWNEFGREQTGELTETMSLQGSCFMLTKDKYFELDICSEDFHSWGQQGVEVACKTWLSGGRVLVNRNTWYAHMFRTQGGDFSFPYENPNSKVIENRKLSRELFAEDKWPLAKHKFQWLIDKFKPPEWTSSKAILYYTSHTCPMRIARKVQHNLKNISRDKNIPLYSSSLKPMPHMGRNIIQPLEHTDYKVIDGELKEIPVPRTQPGLRTMTQQILDGLKIIKEDIVFLCEHDVLYHPTHFDFTPAKEDVYYYNTNVWRLRASDGHCLYYNQRSLSGMCAYRKTLITHYEKRLNRIIELEDEAEKNSGIVKATSGNDIPLKEAIHRLGFEPGTHNRPEKVDDLGCSDYKSELPNIDIRHENNLTQSRWSIGQFRTKPTEWVESDEIPGWGKGNKIIK